jgi:pyruvate dehydrogenase E2 component (dihydrolipoyllysine-residue acetyltransferase)
VTTTIKLPELGENVDLGDLTKILVSVGDTVSKDQPLLELETEKATIEVPSPVSGVIKELHVQEGHKVKVGDLLFTVDENGAAPKQTQKPQAEKAAAEPPARPERKPAPTPTPTPTPTTLRATGAATQGGGAAAAQARQPEPDKKPQGKQEKEPPSKAAPKAEPKAEEREPQRAESQPAARAETGAEAEADAAETENEAPESQSDREESVIPFRAETSEPPRHLAPASPAIRRLARELGVDINKVTGTGPEGRIDEQDVKNYAKEIISRAAGTRPAGETFAALPDFAKWGQIERKPMSNVRRATAEHLAQAWHNVPQVTQFDSADITELESLRSRFSERQDGAAAKITVTAIALKVVAAALRKFPQFAASIDMANRQVIYKHYFNIGVAVDTSYGLVVPVVRDADQKSIPELASELSEVSQRAREKKLSLEEMSGGVFTITNLGGIGGTGFSPIVNYPEVAILGISRLSVEPRLAESQMKDQMKNLSGGSFQPRKILPLSLSYDHRLIDGADAARFLRWVAEALEQPALLLFRA